MADDNEDHYIQLVDYTATQPQQALPPRMPQSTPLLLAIMFSGAVACLAPLSLIGTAATFGTWNKMAGAIGPVLMLVCWTSYGLVRLYQGRLARRRVWVPLCVNLALTIGAVVALAVVVGDAHPPAGAPGPAQPNASAAPTPTPTAAMSFTRGFYFTYKTGDSKMTVVESFKLQSSDGTDNATQWVDSGTSSGRSEFTLVPSSGAGPRLIGGVTGTLAASGSIVWSHGFTSKRWQAPGASDAQGRTRRAAEFLLTPGVWVSYNISPLKQTDTFELKAKSATEYTARSVSTPNAQMVTFHFDATRMTLACTDDLCRSIVHGTATVRPNGDIVWPGGISGSTLVKLGALVDAPNSESGSSPTDPHMVAVVLAAIASSCLALAALTSAVLLYVAFTGAHRAEREAERRRKEAAEARERERQTFLEAQESLRIQDPATMRITVQTLGGRAIPLDMSPENTLGFLAHHLANEAGVAEEDQRLIFGREVLCGDDDDDDDGSSSSSLLLSRRQTLAEIGIGDGDVLHLTMRLRRDAS